MGIISQSTSEACRLTDSWEDRQYIIETIMDLKLYPEGHPNFKEQLLERRPLMEHICVRSSKYD